MGMVVGFKDVFKLIGISIVACCAVFVCTLFLNYNLDLIQMESEITTVAGKAMYEAVISMGKVTAAVSGGCLVLTSVIMLMFYIKNYIDTHCKELGILKALGYSNMKIAKSFWVFGLSVLVGCVVGYVIAYLYLPAFYEQNNTDKLFPDFTVQFHPSLCLLLTVAPTVLFSLISVLYADLKLKRPTINLLKDIKPVKFKVKKHKDNDLPFLQDLSKTTVKSKKILVFFTAFSAFCFSAMVQMSMSMEQLASENFAFMIITIGLILSFMTLFMSLSTVVKGNAKTIAMMRVFGYEYSICSHKILGAYRPFAYIGFVIGTVYQYALLKIMVTAVFSNVENMPEYSFDFRIFLFTLGVFIVVYEAVLYIYSQQIKKLSLKSIMAE